MLSTIKNALAPSPDALVARLRDEIAELETQLNEARSRWNRACIAEEAGEGSAAATTSAQKHLESVSDQLDRKRAALAGAIARRDTDAATAARQAVEDAWDHAMDVEARRRKACRELHKAGEAYAKAYKAAMDATDELRAALPVIPDSYAAVLNWDGSSLEPLARIDLARHGVQWAITWSGGSRSCPTWGAPEMLPQIDAVPGVLRQWREKATGRPAPTVKEGR